MRRLIAAVMSLVLVALVPAVAEGRGAAQAAPTSGEIRIDGRLDEPDWALAPAITDFRLILQREGEAPSESTIVRVLYDREQLFFGIRCANRTAGPIRASLVPRDQITDGDHIAVHLDTYLDRRRAYIFGVNPYGVQLDGILDGDEPDFSWDAVWDAEATRDAGGWTAEIAVPLRTIRFPAGGDGVWGLWIRREITKRDEVCSWPLWRLAEQGDIMLQAGDLAGLAGLRSGGRFEAEPYASSFVTQQDTYDNNEDAFSHDRFTDSNAGLDLRYGLTSTLIANATVNPDYSQVEADAIQIDVNRRYPLFFPEKRPFFLEGADLFTTPLGLVYTRRIADPSYGGKLTGKLGRWSLGAISVRDDGGGSDEGVGFSGIAGADRPGEFHIGRLAYDAGGNSRLGLLAAYHDRDNGLEGAFPTSVPLAPVAQGGNNLVLAGDSRVRLGQRVFFSGQLAWSRTQVDSSADYPGQDIVSHANISDVAYRGQVSYGDGVRELELYQTYFGPEFRDESGFTERVDLRRTGFSSNLTARPENRWLRSVEPILDGYVIHDHAGGLQEWWVSPMVDWLLQKQNHAHTMYVRSMQRWLGRDYDLNTYILNLDNSQWRRLAVSFEMEIGDGIFYGESDAESYKGWTERYTLGATARPSPRLTSELTAERQRFSRGIADGEVFDIWALGAKSTFQFTRALYARIYPQYDTGGKHFDADALVAYVFHPGSVFYLGVNGDYDRLFGKQRPTQRTVFVKASHRFGL